MAPDNSVFLNDLASELIAIRLLDHVKAYDERNKAIIKAVWLALMAGLAAGFRFDAVEPDWPVAYIELPTGQATWHIAQHLTAWDGHTTEQKYERVKQFVDSVGE